MTAAPYSVDYWYRCADDPDQSVRPICQMTAGAHGERAVYAEVARLTAQGYHVQRVIMRLDCEACHGDGQIAARPKGMRRDKMARTPYWALPHRTCRVCSGDGWVDAAELDLSAGRSA